MAEEKDKRVKRSEYTEAVEKFKQLPGAVFPKELISKKISILNDYNKPLPRFLRVISDHFIATVEKFGLKVTDDFRNLDSSRYRGVARIFRNKEYFYFSSDEECITQLLEGTLQFKNQLLTAILQIPRGEQWLWKGWLLTMLTFRQSFCQKGRPHWQENRRLFLIFIRNIPHKENTQNMLTQFEQECEADFVYAPSAALLRALWDSPKSIQRPCVILPAQLESETSDFISQASKSADMKSGNKLAAVPPVIPGKFIYRFWERPWVSRYVSASISSALKSDQSTPTADHLENGQKI